MWVGGWIGGTPPIKISTYLQGALKEGGRGWHLVRLGQVRVRDGLEPFGAGGDDGGVQGGGGRGGGTTSAGLLFEGGQVEESLASAGQQEEEEGGRPTDHGLVCGVGVGVGGWVEWNAAVCIWINRRVMVVCCWCGGGKRSAARGLRGTTGQIHSRTSPTASHSTRKGVGCVRGRGRI